MGGLEGGKKLRRLSDGEQLRYAQLPEFAIGELYFLPSNMRFAVVNTLHSSVALFDKTEI